MKVKEYIADLVRRPWPKSIIREAVVSNRDEMPRFPVRFWTNVVGLGLLLISLFIAFIIGNPFARIRDPHLSSQYNSVPLTALAIHPGENQVWLGSQGGGLKVYDTKHHLFEQALTRASTGDGLLSDFVQDVKFGSNHLAAIVVADGPNGGGGVQMANLGATPHFWKRPCVAMTPFPGLDDATASATVESPDGRWLVVGTRGHGLGIYSEDVHAWKHLLTTKDGLPSDHINDLATMPAAVAGKEFVVWVATDKGLCGGQVATDGRFVPRWNFNRRTGLAGDNVVRLIVNGSHLWYYTREYGLGRIQLETAGAPASETAHQMLITERRLPGLTDSSFRLAASSPSGPTTWFISEITNLFYIGRYRELPHDTAGIRLPSALANGDVTCMAADMQRGDAALLGTQAGAWFYTDTPAAAGDGAVAAATTVDLTGGFVGPSNAVIAEATLLSPAAAIKVRGNKNSMLRKAAVAATTDVWAWPTLVGEGRFPNLTSEHELTCVAASNTGSVFFGTAGKGIGIWDRRAMEVRREFHSSNEDAATKLRDDTALALAVTADNKLLQVTGDHAVDVFDGQQRMALVPTSAAPFVPSAITSATADGSFFAAAGGGKIGLYDARSFAWADLPSIPGLTRLEVTRNMLWAVDQAGSLFSTSMDAAEHNWTTVLQGGVQNVAASSNALYVIVQASGQPAQLRAYSGFSGELSFQISPQPLPAENTHWRYAAAFDDGLYLHGEEASFHYYSLKTRSWHSVRFPDAIRAPLRQMGQTGNSIWMVDAGLTLHQYQPAADKFRTDVDKDVDHLVCGAAAVLVRKAPDKEGRLTLHGDGDEAGSHVLIGKGFDGQMASATDAVEYDKKLVVAQGNKIGFYQWDTHTWTTVPVPVEPLTALHSVGTALWALGGGKDSSALLAWDGKAQFLPVKVGGETPAIRSVTVGATGLFALGADGSVLFVSSEHPAEATVLLAASRLASATPAPVRPELTALLDHDLVLFHDQALHCYAPSGNVARWTSTPFEGDPLQRLVSAPEDKLVVAQGRTNGWFIRKADDGRLSAAPVLNDYPPEGGPLEVSGMAAGAGAALCAVRVANESGSRVVSRNYDAPDLATVIGAALPAAGPSQAGTKAVVVDPASGGLVRLDDAHRVAFYDTKRHDWKVELTPDEAIDELWRVGPKVVAYSRAQASVWFRRAGVWQQHAATKGEIQNALPFNEGLLVWLKRGAVALLTPQEDCRAIRSWPTAATGPGMLGVLKSAAESDDLLALMDDTGRLAAYDWRAQAWLSTAGGATQLVQCSKPAGLYVLRSERGALTLAGPLTRSSQNGQNGLSGPSIPCDVGLLRIEVNDNGLFALGVDRAIYRLEDGRLQRWWGGVGGGASGLHGKVLAAEESNGDLSLAVREDDLQTVALRISAATLGASRTAVTSGTVERLLPANGGKVLAQMRDDNGRSVADLIRGERLTAPDRELLACASVNNELYGLRNGAVVQLGTGKRDDSALPFAALPAQGAAAAQPSFVALGAHVLAQPADGKLYAYCGDAAGWTPLAAEDNLKQGAFWLHGSRVLYVKDDTLPVVLECLAGTPPKLQPLPCDAPRREKGNLLSYGTPPASAAGVALRDAAGTAYAVTLVSKGSAGAPEARPYVFTRDRMVAAASAVRTGTNSWQLLVTSPEGKERVLDIGQNGALREDAAAVADAGAAQAAGQADPAVSKALVDALRSKLTGTGSNLVCYTAGSAWGVQEGVLCRLSSPTGLLLYAHMGAPLPAGVAAQTLACLDDKLLVQSSGGEIFRFTGDAGFVRIATGVRSLFRLDNQYFAIPSSTRFALWALNDEASAFLPAQPSAWEGLALGPAVVYTGTAPKNDTAWKLPVTLTAEFLHGEDRLHFLPALGRMDADVLTDIMGAGDVLCCQSKQGVQKFRKGRDGVWAKLDAAAAQAVPAPSLPPLAGKYGSFTIQAAPDGAWQDGRSPGRLDLRYAGRDHSQQIVPSARYAALAHEVVNDIAAQASSLYAATEQGLVVLSSGAEGKAIDVSMPQDSEGLPRGELKIVSLMPQPVCLNARNEWYELQAKTWRRASITVGALVMAERANANQRFLEHWRFVETPNLQANLLERKFAGAQWRQVSLQPSGFDFEQTFAADIDSGKVVFYTGAGELAFPLAGDEPLVPIGLENRCQPPAGRESGLHHILRGPDKTVFLSPVTGPLDAKRMWVREQDAWRPLTGKAVQAFDQLQAAPLLQDEHWMWQRSTAGLPDKVSWAAGAASTLASVFNVATGRLGWDQCQQIGQAGGQLWALTDAGLFRITDGQLDLASHTPPPGEGQGGGGNFADVSGDMPGALLDKTGKIVLVGQDGWKLPSAVPAPLLDLITNYRVAGSRWRASRKGELFRSRPQEPAAFDPVSLKDNRWTFEQLNALAAENDTCYAATDGGLLGLSAQAGGLTAFWGNVGKADDVQMAQRVALAKLADGSVLQHEGASWRKSAAGWPANQGPLTVAGDRWTIVKEAGKLAFQAKRQAAGAAAAVLIETNDFAFDHVYDAYPLDADHMALSTADGLHDRIMDGDLKRVKAAAALEEFTFSSVPDGLGPQGALYAMGKQGSYLKYAAGWTPLSRAEGQAALALAASRRAMSKRWLVTKPADGPLAFALHLDADPPNSYKPVVFNEDKRLFGFDDFHCVAPMGAGDLLIGTAYGLQAIGSVQDLLRLWCDEPLDGLAPRSVEQTVRGVEGRLQIQAGDRYYTVADVKEKLQPSFRVAFDQAVAIRASDAEGWTVKMLPATPDSLKISWRQQPVFLVGTEEARSRFAHNLVNSVCVLSDKVLLGTEGGLLRLDSADPKTRENFALLSKPFAHPATGSARARGGSVTRLWGAPKGELLHAQLKGDAERTVWQVNLASFTNAAQADLSAADFRALNLVQQDDILQWQTTGTGQVAVTYAPGKCVPDTLKPQVQNQTFSFLDLDLPEDKFKSSTLAATDLGMFWLSRGGIIQYDPVSATVQKVFGATADGARSLTNANHLQWSAKDHLLYARGPEGQFRYQPAAAGWETVRGASPLDDPSLITDGSLFTWRQMTNSVAVALKQSDAPDMLCFAGGKPLVDAVNDFAFVAGQGEETVLLGTQAGVVDYKSDDFVYRGLKTVPFTTNPRAPQAVVQIAAATGSATRVVCRTAASNQFERTEATWAPTADAGPVFEQSYRRVSHPGYWNWSRYPEGLTCTLLMANGAPFTQGAAVKPGLPAIFSHGKLAFDDAVAVFLTDDLQLLISTPVGVARYQVIPGQETWTMSGVDVWAGAEPAAPTAMLGLGGLVYDSRKVLAWNGTSLFENSKPAERKWAPSKRDRASLANLRTWNDESGLWTIGLSAAGAGELSATYSRFGTGRWTVPSEAKLIQDVGCSGDGLWCLANNELFQVSQWRAQWHWVRWVRTLLPGGVPGLRPGALPDKAAVQKK